MAENPLEEGEALVLMGHGTEHESGSVYSRLQQVFEEGKFPAFIAVVDGSPSFADALEKLTCSGARQARLLPLMLVAGDHARKDMAGEENSLLSMVREAGVEPKPLFRGLGESPGVQLLYVKRAREAAGKLASDVMHDSFLTL